MVIDGDKTFYTATMARVYARQGRYDAAARIYRYLLDQAPGREDLQQELSSVLSMTSAGGSHGRVRLELVQCWVRWMLRYQAMRRLQTIKDKSLGTAAQGGEQACHPPPPA